MRIYSRVSSPAERERPTQMREAVHDDRDASIHRGDLHPEMDARRWINPTSLDAPAPRPGHVQRWVRDGSSPTADDRDVAHYMRKVREGWSPRDPATIPAAERRMYPSVKSAGGDDMIRVAGLVLMEMPIHVANQRRQAMMEVNQNQMQAIAPSAEQLRGAQFAGVGGVQQEDRVAAYQGRKANSMVD